MRTIVVAGLAAVCATSLVAACATVEEAAVESVSKTYEATLTGAEEPGGGDPDGYGEAEVSVSDKLDQVCWELEDLRGLGPITAAHIHRGARGVNGPPVVTLKPANEGGWKGCSNKAEWLEDSIERNFTAYYVNVHTAEFPSGAIRGQLHE